MGFRECLLLPWSSGFLWYFRVKVVGRVLEGRGEFQIPVCAWERDFLLSNGTWSHAATLGAGKC
jgi:hypothetical protein